MEHGHQQLGQHDNHHDVVGANDHGTHKRVQLLCVGDAGDKKCDMCQGEDVPEQGVAGPHKPAKKKKLRYVRRHLTSHDRHNLTQQLAAPEQASLFPLLFWMTARRWPIRVECIIALLLAEYSLAVLGLMLVRVFPVLPIKLSESDGEGE